MSYPGLSAPTNCQLEITTQCTHKCLHCYNFWRNDDKSEPKRTLTEEASQTIIQKLVGANVFDITFTGGEPLLAFDILMSGIRQARDGGISVHLNSNLLPLTLNRARELSRAGLKSVLTSLMGPDAETYNAIARHPNAFDQVVRNIRIAQDTGIEVVANMVVTKVNLHQVKETAQFANSLGIRKFAATKASCPGNCRDFSEYALTVAEFRNYLQNLSEAGTELSIDVDALEGYPLCGVKDLGAYRFAKNRRCTAGINSIAIGSDGAVRPCAHFDTSYGNALVEDLSQIWGRMSDWRDGVFLPTICKRCVLLGVCGGGCRMEAKMCRGDSSAPDPYCVSEDVDFALRSLQACLDISQSKATSVKEGAWFSILPHRSRNEPFGVTVRIPNRPHVFLSDTGAQVLSQMQVGTAYQIGEGSIQWRDIRPLEFVEELIARGVAKMLTETPE